MNDKARTASDQFLGGLNCAQAVLASFCGDYGIDKDIAFRIACGLGSGVRSAELCGAVSGAVLVIGLKYGDSIETCSSKTEEFIKVFKDKNKHIVCRELLNRNITTPEGRESALTDKLFTTKCLDLVVSAVNILEDLGY